MKIFAVYAKVELSVASAWLAGFRRKYDEPYDYHITLKQPCYVDENSLAEIKDKLASVLRELNGGGSELQFNQVAGNPDLPTGGCIMINAKDAPWLKDLQKRITAALANYKDYVKAGSDKWEREFQPHITIARHLSPQQYAAAMTEIPENYQCKGAVREVALAVVNNFNVSEATDPKNLTIYKL